MISYDTRSWRDVLTRWAGSTVSSCWPKVLVVLLYLCAAYALQLAMGQNLGLGAFDHSEIIGKALSFLLVFRADTSYKRFWAGRMEFGEFFAGLRDLATLSCTACKGGHGQYVWNRRAGQDGFSMERRAGLNDDDDRRASNARTDCVRWCMALAISFRIMMRMTGQPFYDGTMNEESKWRLNFDRMRLRSLMSKAEFEEVDRALRVEDTGEERRLLWQSGRAEPQAFHVHSAPQQPGGRYSVSLEPTYPQLLVLMNFLTRSVREHSKEPYGYSERFMADILKLASGIRRCHDHVNLSMTTPLPFPYVNLVRTLLIAYLFSLPFFTTYTDGVFANVVMPTLTALALLGIDHIGSELENPFGDDFNDLDIMPMIVGLEKEMLRMLMLSGDLRAREDFVFLPVPKFMQEESTKPFLWYVALRREVEQAELPRCRTQAGLRIKHVNLPER